METCETAALVHKTNEAVENFGIGEDLSIAAVHKHRVVIENFGILEIVQIVTEDRLEGACRVCHFLDGEVGVRRGVVIVSACRSNIHDEKLPGRFGR